MDGNSIAVSVMPSNNRSVYYDGTYDQGYMFQVMTKHQQQLEAYQTLLRITDYLDNVPDIPSHNNSYDFNGITVVGDPNVIGREGNHYYYVAQFRADLYIKRSELNEAN
ncbi:hypothetical protein [Bacillus sp. JCM 19041]|uniref:phage tail terminator protein n=1 Tax=Bacillus sp. JCM 19041 TaxID=1460637 RepID=UPI0018D1A885